MKLLREKKRNNKKMRVEHVEIVGHKDFSSACYLVEISKCTNTAIKYVYFCRECIAHPRKEMLVLLKIIIDS